MLMWKTGGDGWGVLERVSWEFADNGPQGSGALGAATGAIEAVVA